MKFSEFLSIYGDQPIIEAETFPLYSNAPQQIRSQVSRWVKKGWLIPLKRGVYAFNEIYCQRHIPLAFLANYLSRPSYISMEYALGFYHLIPEKIVTLSSVTTKKTAFYDNAFGRFRYYSVKNSLFTGYTTCKEEGQEIFMASPEKAILDFFYINQSRFSGEYGEFEAMRFQNLEQLNTETLKGYKKIYGPKMRKIITKFVQYIQDVEKQYKRLCT